MRRDMTEDELRRFEEEELDEVEEAWLEASEAVEAAKQGSEAWVYYFAHEPPAADGRIETFESRPAAGTSA